MSTLTPQSTTPQAPTPGTSPAESTAETHGTSNAWALVARREIAVRALDKSFIISTFITVALLAAFLGWTAYSEGRTSRMRSSPPMPTPTGASPPLSPHRSTTGSRSPRAPSPTRPPDCRRGGRRRGRLPPPVRRRLGADDRVPGRWAAGDPAQSARRRSTAGPGATTAAEPRRAPSSVRIVGDAERAGLAQAIGFAMALLFFMFALMLVCRSPTPSSRRSRADSRDHRDRNPLRHLSPARSSGAPSWPCCRSCSMSASVSSA